MYFGILDCRQERTFGVGSLTFNYGSTFLFILTQFGLHILKKIVLQIANNATVIHSLNMSLFTISVNLLVVFHAIIFI